MTASFIPSLLKELDDVTITTPAVGHGIRYDGAKWANQQLSHLDLTNVGVNTHVQIDTHIASAINPHSATLTQQNLTITGTVDINNTAPVITLTDTTPSAKSLKIGVDANIAQIREIAGASGPLISLDLVNNNMGIGTITPSQKLDIEKGHIRLGQVEAPSSAPTPAVGAAGVLTGGYYYRISFVTALGETETGPLSAGISPSSQQVNLSAIPVSGDSAVTSRRIYRTTSNGGTVFMRLAATISDNVTTTYTDNIADGSLGVSESRVNTTGGLIFNGTTRAGIIDNATTAIGMRALLVNAGYNNCAVGVDALLFNTVGLDNCAVGVDALRFNTTGLQNSAIGKSALRVNTTGSDNNAIGMGSLGSNTTGGQNVGVGVRAGNVIADGSTANQASSTSVYLGTDTKSLASGDSNEIVIGYNAVGLGSNTVVLGNSSIVTTTLRGSVGINTTMPTISGTGKLHMAADTFRLDTARTPATAGATGNTGEICWDANYIYVCVATNSWKRAALAVW